ncbi:MAG: hypothetical protein AB1393_10335 [Candidatus Edwardsbacteria bacterium]
MYRFYQKISEEFMEKVSTVLLTPEEAEETKPFYLDMTINSEIIFDRNDFFKNILKRVKKRLKELGAERKLDAEGDPYWILKRNAKPGEEIVL